jgi:hypothetical protein
MQGAHLQVPPDELAQRPGAQPLDRRAPRPDPGYPEGHHGPAPAPQWHGTKLLQAGIAGHHAGGGSAYHDRPRFRPLLQEARHGGRFSDDAQAPLGPRADLCDCDQARVQGHAQHRGGGPVVVRHTRRGPWLVEPSLEPERRQYTPPGMVLVRYGHAEKGHDAVAQKAADRPLEASDLRLRLLEEVVQEGEHPLRPQALGQTPGVHKLAEQDRRLLVLPLRSR